jgi:GAF domain-containing protein
MASRIKVERFIERINESELELEALVQFVLTRLLNELGADSTTLMLYDHRLERLVMYDTATQDPEMRKNRYETALENENPHKGITSWVYSNRDYVRVGNVYTDTLWKDYYIASDPNTISELDVVLSTKSLPIGVLGAESYEENFFTEDDVRDLKRIADTFALKLDNVRVAHNLKRLDDGFLHIGDITRELFELDEEAILQFIMRNAMDLTDTQMGNLLLCDPQDKTKMNMKICEGADYEDGYFQRVDENDGIVGYCAFIRTTVNEPDIRKNRLYKQILSNMRSELAQPILIGDELKGVINLESEHLSAFDEVDEQLIKILAITVAGALQHLEQKKKLNLATERTNALNRLHEGIEKTDNQKTDKYKAVMEMIVAEAKFLTDSDYASFHHWENDSLKRSMDSDGDGRDPQREKIYGANSSGRGVVQYLADSLQNDPNALPYYLTNDAQNDDYFVGSKSMRSDLAYAALREDKGVVCIINVESEWHTYDESDIETLSHLAEFAILAINHVRSARNLDLLNKVSKELMTINHIDAIKTAYDLVVNIAHEHTQKMRVVIRRLHGPTLLVPVSNVRDELYKRPNDLLANEDPNREAFFTNAVVYIKDTRKTPYPQANSEFRAIMLAPLIAENKPYGTLTFAKTRPKSFDKIDEDFLSALADLLAQTIHRLDQAYNIQSLNALNNVATGLANSVHSISSSIDQVRIILNSFDLQTSLVEGGRGKELYALPFLFRQIERIKNLSSGIERHSKQWDESEHQLINIHDDLFDYILDSSYADEGVPIYVGDSHPDANSIYANMRDIQECLDNIVGNAIRIIKRKGKGTGIRMYTDMKGDIFGKEYVHVIVEDDGIGIPPDMLNKIFNMGVKGEDVGNTGMGLYLTRSFAVRNGGEVWAENVGNIQGNGAIFTMRFPKPPTP